MANEKLFSNVTEPKKAGVVQPEATTQEPANTAEAVAEKNKLAGLNEAEKAKEPEAADKSGIPALTENSTAGLPAPVVPVPSTIHDEAKQPAPTALATTNVVAADGTDELEPADEDTGPDDLQKPDQLTMLKRRADLMGITYSNNIGLDTLRAKINAQLTEEAHNADPADKESNVSGEDPQTATIPPLSGGSVGKVKKMNIRQYMFNEKMKLVRLRITNLDPKKKDLQGEIFTIANEYLGTVRKFIPYGEVTDNGFHVPYCLYELLRDKQFVSIKTRKGTNGQPIVETQMVKEFSLDVLPPLTPDELAKLSATQQMNQSID